MQIKRDNILFKFQGISTYFWSPILFQQHTFSTSNKGLKLEKLHGMFNYFSVCQLFNLALKTPFPLFFNTCSAGFLSKQQNQEVQWFWLTLVGRVYFPSGRGTPCTSPQVEQTKARLVHRGLMLLTLTTVPRRAMYLP